MPPVPSKVDAAVNVFAKPYQTALSVLSLLRWSGERIDRVFMQFEPKGSRYDSVPPYAVAEYLGSRAVVTQPELWLRRETPDRARLDDAAYRLSIRYEYAFERTDKRHLFILHNDVLVLKDIVGAMLELADGFFAVGGIGQCWNCPAADAALVGAAGLGDEACSPDRYADFRPDFAGLGRLYALAEERGVFARPYPEGWDEHYAAANPAWPLPECRVNEWGCLVDVALTRAHVVPQGDILPFGAFEQCGSTRYDTAAAWFRELNRLGLRAKHMDTGGHLRHWVGNDKMMEKPYREAEDRARLILEKNFAPFVNWCRKRDNGLFV